MALKKAITQQSGYDANYWRIDRVEIDWRSRYARIRLSGYKNETERNQNPQDSVMNQRHYNITDNFNKFFDTPDKDDIPQYDSTLDYQKGDKVLFNNVIYKAAEDIASGGPNPDKTISWEVSNDLRVNRKIAYNHIKNNDIDFTDAVDA
jgi:hypothetical protein